MAKKHEDLERIHEEQREEVDAHGVDVRDGLVLRVPECDDLALAFPWRMVLLPIENVELAWGPVPVAHECRRVPSLKASIP